MKSLDELLAPHRQRVELARQAAGLTLLEMQATHKQKPTPAERRAQPRQTWRDLVINELVARDGPDCYLCHAPLNVRLSAAIHIDHIVPASLEGDHLLHNLALACPDCNTKKADKIVAFSVTSGKPWYALQAQIREAQSATRTHYLHRR